MPSQARQQRVVTEVQDESPFLRDVVGGLRSRPKHLSPKYFYDREGALLFDAICALPEYYLTRTELGILRENADEIADHLTERGPCRIVEPGAGNGQKTRLLLHALGPRRCTEYVPLDIAGDHLEECSQRLRKDLPWLRVSPRVADFTRELDTSRVRTAARTVVYFPGSTIGNFEPREATSLLRRFRRAASADGCVLVGVDLKKDPAILHAAYNDACGMTAAFNKNVLRRMNSELGASIDLETFRHYAFYAPEPGRIEMHLVSTCYQEIEIACHRFAFDEGESLCTEHSYKYDIEGAKRLAAAAGLTLAHRWTDPASRFAVLLFRASRLRG